MFLNKKWKLIIDQAWGELTCWPDTDLLYISKASFLFCLSLRFDHRLHCRSLDQISCLLYISIKSCLNRLKFSKENEHKVCKGNPWSALGWESDLAQQGVEKMLMAPVVCVEKGR